MTQTIAPTRTSPERAMIRAFAPYVVVELVHLVIHFVVMSSHLVAQGLIAAGVLRILRTERW